MDKQLRNTTTPADRAKQFADDQRRLRQPPEPTTLHQLQHVSDELDAQGRFAGTKPETAFPALPASSPWSGDPVGVEPPIGIDVSYVEPVGEAHEIAASMAAQSSEPGVERTGMETSAALSFPVAEDSAAPLGSDPLPGLRELLKKGMRKPEIRIRRIDQ